MSAVLEVETTQFVQVARRLESDVAEPLSIAFARLNTALDGCGAMAGGDPGGQDWARSYDAGARDALTAHVSAVNAGYRLSTLFGQSARNYEQADLASRPGSAETAGVSAAVAQLTGPIELFAAGSPPSAAGGSGSTPAGWWLVEHTIGYVWPDGHQDRLRAAASAWAVSSQALGTAACEVMAAGFDFSFSGVPEGADMTRVCRGFSEGLFALSQAQQSLATDCRALADRIDQVHAEVEGELQSLLDQTAVIQAAGAVLSFVTFGAAELSAQGIEATRVAEAVAFIGTRIEEFLAAARLVAASASAAVERVGAVVGQLRTLSELPVVVAMVSGVRRVPGLARTLKVLEQSRAMLMARTENWETYAAHLERAAEMTGKENTLGAFTQAEANLMGDAWVGAGARSSRNGMCLISRDGLRQYRPMYWKTKDRIWRANLERRLIPDGPFPDDVHIDITDHPIGQS